jgi:transcriptional regulator
MRRIAQELTDTSAGLKEYLKFTFDEVDPKSADFVNSICSDIDDLADRIRRNENLSMVVERASKDGETEVRIMMTEHEAMKAIREELAERVSKLGEKRKLDIKVD